MTPRKPPVKTTGPRKLASVKSNSDADLDARLREGVPTTIEPGYQGHQLRVAGLPWAEVAEKIGSPTPTAAMFVVRRYLAEAAKAQSDLHLQEALQTQIDRYERILQAWWERATEGHSEKAAMVVLRAMERLDRVLRLTDSDVIVSRETIVVSADPESYVKQLQSVVADRSSKSIEP